MVVERWDNAALSGNDVYAFISDRAYTIPELCKNLYALAPVFHVGDERLALEWLSGSELEIRCAGCAVTKKTVTTQKTSQAGVLVLYIDFP